jgi:hypothetical protein
MPCPSKSVVGPTGLNHVPDSGSLGLATRTTKAVSVRDFRVLGHAEDTGPNAAIPANGSGHRADLAADLHTGIRRYRGRVASGGYSRDTTAASLNSWPLLDHRLARVTHGRLSRPGGNCNQMRVGLRQLSVSLPSSGRSRMS